VSEGTPRRYLGDIGGEFDKGGGSFLFRKDADCDFVILKGRFGVLKTGIRVDGPESADKIWLICCALHNCVLEADGLDDWDGEIGLNDFSDLSYAPFVLQREPISQFFGSRENENAASVRAVVR
jgi:hypothetical protein